MVHIILRFIIAFGYAGVYIFTLTGLLINIFFLFDDGIDLIYLGNKDVGWLYLLIIPLEMVVMVAYIVIVTPYVAP